MQGLCRRLWNRDPGLWTVNRLGWLGLPESMLGQAPMLSAFAEEVRRESLRHVLLLGMGGSSLFPDVLARCFRPAPGFPDLTVLDTTDPDAIRSALGRLDLDRTLVLVSSKSGTTLETLSLYKHLAGLIRDGGRFAAITDPGTPLEALARERGFRRVFAHPSDVGGRYSALSCAGLLPAALLGLPLKPWIESATEMARTCGPDVPEKENPAFRLGTAIAEASLAGRDKLTLLLPRDLAPFGNWIEQLVAESTGKQGRGILPVQGEPAGSAASYGPDRFFVRLGGEGGNALVAPVGHPCLDLSLDFSPDLKGLGGACFLWEMATAVAGAVLGVDPFDEPDVQASKDLTRRILSGNPPAPTVAAEPETLAALARPGDFLALLAWLPPSPEMEKELQAIRVLLRDRLGLSTTLGFGPRYLHSTGQFHKGGTDRGLYLFLTCDASGDLPIPGEAYSFGALKSAQAVGDLSALAARGRRVFRRHLGKDVTKGLRTLRGGLDSAMMRR